MSRPCTCSVRAFEIFVKDIAGLTIKSPSQHSRALLVRRPRHYSTARESTSIGTSVSETSHDRSIPFVFERKIDPGTPLNANGAIQAERTDEKDDRHTRVGIVHSSQADLETTSSERTANILALDESADPVELHEPDEAWNGLSAPSRDLRVEDTSINNLEAIRTRTENRQARKMRRVEAGTFRKDAEARLKEQRNDAPLGTVSKTIQATDGAEGLVRNDLRAKRAEQRSKDGKQKVAKTNLREDDSHQVPSDGDSVGTETPKNENTSQQGSWRIQKEALKQKFGETGWQPRKRLSPDTLDGIRALHTSDPESYTTKILAQHFEITPEAIRRILKSKWRPNEDEVERRRVRWEKRGERKWTAMAAEGTRPPAKWRAKGIRTPWAEGKRKTERRRKDNDVPWESEVKRSPRPSLSARIL